MNVLLTGAAGSGKTARILGEFRYTLPSTRARVVVPTATLATHLRNELVRDGVVFHPSGVDTLAHFIQELAPDAHQASEEFFHLAVESAVAQLARPEFSEVAALPGFAKRLARTLSDLDAAGCTPAHLKHLDLNKAPYRDALAAIWTAVIDQLHQRGLVTRAQLLRDLTARTPANLPAQIWFDGFAQLATPELNFICALGKHTRVTIALADEGGSHSLKETLRDRGFQEEHLAGSRQPETILVVPEDEEREAAEIARRILEHHAAGLPFREIGIVLRKPESYTPILRLTLERFGIPAHFYFRSPLSRNPAGRLLIGVVEALLGGWDHAQVLELLRFVPFTGTSSALDAFELELRKRLPGHGLEALLEAAGKRRTITRPLRQFAQLEAWRQLALTPDEWARHLAQLPALFAPRLVPDQVSPAAVAEFRSFAAGMKAFAEAATEVARWWLPTPAPINLAKFWCTAVLLVPDALLTSEPRSHNTVHVVDTFEARQWDLEVVFIPGLIEKQFPAQNDRDPFLPDPALRELSSHGIYIRTASQKDDEEQHLFDTARTRARRQVVFSYPRSNARGQRVLPSIFLKELTAPDTFPLVVQPATPPSIAPWTALPRVSSEHLLSSLALKPQKLTVSSLERLLECPFQFFAEKTLKLAEMPPEPEDRADFLFQGNVAHETLLAWWHSGKRIADVFARVFAAQCVKYNVQAGFRTERCRRAILTSLIKFEADQQYPRTFQSETEQSFQIALDPDLIVSGRFDRVDRLPNGRAAVIDYKFSADALTKDRIEDETKLQGPLYAHALREQFGIEAETVLYISLKGPKISYYGWGNPPPGSDLKPLNPMQPDWIDDALARTRAAVADFRSGRIHPEPAHIEKCRYCAVRDACRFEPVR